MGGASTMATTTLHLLPILVAAVLVAAQRLPTTAADAADNRTLGGFSLRLETSHADDAGITLSNLRPVVVPLRRLAYSVVVRFGTAPHVHDYKLWLGMGGLTWIRCKPCHPELQQEGPLYDPALSRSFHAVAGSDPLCQHIPGAHAATNGRCAFRVLKAEGSVGRETISFSSSSPDHAMPGFVFGCASATSAAFMSYGAFAGALGLGRPVAGSLLAQLTGARVDALRFSYCLSNQAGARGYLRFGDDVPADAGPVRYAHTILLPPLHAGETSYHVGLVGISLNGARIEAVTAPMFARRAGGATGGCVVDAGSQMTQLPDRAYQHVEAAVLRYMNLWGAERVHPSDPKLRLCFRRTERVTAHVPTVTLHFHGGADLHLQAKEVLMNIRDDAGRDEMCFLLVPCRDDQPAVIGALQQVDTRFVFDIRAGTLSFRPERCHQDSSSVPASLLNGAG